MNNFSLLLRKTLQNKSFLLIGVAVIFHVIGLIGITSVYQDDFLKVSFLNLALVFILLLIDRKSANISFYIFLILAYFIGMASEWIGIHTGYLFGDYVYGKNLGLLWFGVPFIIGINWVVLTIISASIVVRIKVHWFFKAFIGTLLMLFLDILIEPVAIQIDYWTWQQDIPVSNFASWFLVAFIIQLMYFSLRLAEPKKVPSVIYIIQVLFFIILNISL